MRPTTDLRAEVIQICTSLNSLGISKSDLLLKLISIACPGVPEIYSVASELLGLVKWFEKKDDAMIREALERAPSDAVAFRVFWSVRQVVLLLNRMSNLQILHLGDEMIPPGSEEMQVSFLAAWQQELQHWSTERVRELHSVVHATPIHLERQRVSGVVQQAQFVEITLSVLKLPLEQLVSFHVWFCGLGPSLLKQLVLLLTSMSSAQLIELRSLLLLPSMQQPGQQPDSVVEPVRPVLVARDELVNSLMSGFSPDASYPTHVGGPMKVSVGSLDFGVVPMDMGFADDDFGVHNLRPISPPFERVDSDPLNPTKITPSLMLGRSDSDPFNPAKLPVAPKSNVKNGGNDNNVPIVKVKIPSSAAASLPPQPPVNVAPFEDDEDGDEMDEGDDEEFDGNNELMPPAAFATASDAAPSHFQLRIVVQPSAKTVYQRILRPYPSVMLEGAAPGANFFVDCTLCTNDSEEPLSCLSGAAKTRISNGLYATFKKLKGKDKSDGEHLNVTNKKAAVNSTSQQIGSLLRLRFQLKSFNGTSFADVPGVVALSQPIEVFSHTHYLNNKKKGQRPAPPTISDVVPCAVRLKGGCKVVILGSNFVKCPTLKAKIGTCEVPANFHESGTLWVIVPPMAAGRYPVAASNDGIYWAKSATTIEYVE